MSITLRAFALDADEYRAAQGSGDLALAEQILADAAEEIAAEDSWASRLRADHLPIGTALRDIVTGSLRPGRSAAISYHLAALLLAEALGERIDDDAIAEVSERVQPAMDEAIGALVREYGGKPGEWPLLADVLTRGPALDLPPVPETLPNGTGLLSAAETLGAARLLDRIPPQPGDGARELAMTYGGWLVQAAGQQRALLLACD